VIDVWSEEFIDAGPAFGIQSGIDGTGTVSEDVPQGAADPGIFFLKSLLALGISWVSNRELADTQADRDR